MIKSLFKPNHREDKQFTLASSRCYYHALSPIPCSYRIVRRRVIWLLGCWTGVKMSSELRPTLYTILIPLLNPTEDLVVRIEAALTLKLDILDKHELIITSSVF